MVRVFTSGPTAENTSANTLMTKNKDMEFILIPMDERTKGSGSTVNSMVKAFLWTKPKTKGKASGSTASALDG
jgi:hypothetical protein